jgi:hypothetical protein
MPMDWVGTLAGHILLQAVLWYSGYVYKDTVQRSVHARYIDTNVCAER